MTREELEKRMERAESEPWIIAQTEGGFRIHSPRTGGGPYRVSGVPNELTCGCPDFQKHAQDPQWRCKHILAVLKRHGNLEDAGTHETQEQKAVHEQQADTDRNNTSTHQNGGSRMLLKRSVSPDGRIDALSVEFSCPVQETEAENVERRAQELLDLQEEIVGRFLTTNGRESRPEPSPELQPADHEDGTTPAQLLRIGGTDGKWGRRLFLTIQANGRTLRLYGSRGQLAEHLNQAGYSEHAGKVREGVSLNLPCRIITQPTENGFLNIQKVLPANSRPSRQP